MTALRLIGASTALSLALATGGMAQTSPFEDGWALDQSTAHLNFVSIKKGSVIELSRFATVAGEIGEDGDVTITVPLESVDTAIDLRDVRMRFLFFQTFEYPTARITTRLEDAVVADLEQVGSKTVKLPLTIDLHKGSVTQEVEVLISLIGPNRVSVSSVAPVLLKLEEFGLLEGLAALEDAAKVSIVPATSVTFNVTFHRNGTGGEEQLVFANMAADATPRTLAPDACRGRFEILSETRNIQFENESAALKPESTPLLSTVAEIIQRCPDMQIKVAGHTDSRGAESYNLQLSAARADAVVDVLVRSGVPADRLISEGFGESQPIASNDTREGRAQNRRIAFSVVGANG